MGRTGKSPIRSLRFHCERLGFLPIIAVNTKKKTYQLKIIFWGFIYLFTFIFIFGL